MSDSIHDEPQHTDAPARGPELPKLPSFRVEGEPAPARTSEIERSRESQPMAADDRHGGTGLVRHDVVLDPARIDADAASVVLRLVAAGFEAYLVGGCVRDLLLGSTPKDFDVATSARPEDVRGLFRNCRIIGRRFRLAHVVFGQKVIEVATFRRNPQTETTLPRDIEASSDRGEPEPFEGEELLIRNDNAFGEADEDALRRDFTLNALFYDLERKQVLDWTGGMAHVRERTLRTIGDPDVRFQEDPVRILRAVKFAGRLDIGIAPMVYDSMLANRDHIALAARPRLGEEIVRLLRGGEAQHSMWLLWDTGAMHILLPELAAFLDDHRVVNGPAERFWLRMNALDAFIEEHGVPHDFMLWTVLLFDVIAEAVAGAADARATLEDFLEHLIARVSMPRRVADAVRRIYTHLPAIAAGRGRTWQGSDFFGAALDVLEVHTLMRGVGREKVDALRERYGVAAAAPVAAQPKKLRRRFRGPRR